MVDNITWKMVDNKTRILKERLYFVYLFLENNGFQDYHQSMSLFFCIWYYLVVYYGVLYPHFYDAQEEMVGCSQGYVPFWYRYHIYVLPFVELNLGQCPQVFVLIQRIVSFLLLLLFLCKSCMFLQVYGYASFCIKNIYIDR